MGQKLKAEVLISIPPEYTLILTTDYNDLLKDNDVGTWWTLKEVCERTNRSERWLKDTILEVPKYKRDIDIAKGGFVKYPTGGKSGYLFLATKTKQFLEDNFVNILGGK